MRPMSSNFSYNFGTLDWWRIVKMSDQSPSRRNMLTVLRDCEAGQRRWYRGSRCPNPERMDRDYRKPSG